jgi:hypothetical protein
VCGALRGRHLRDICCLVDASGTQTTCYGPGQGEPCCTPARAKTDANGNYAGCCPDGEVVTGGTSICCPLGYMVVGGICVPIPV